MKDIITLLSIFLSTILLVSCNKEESKLPAIAGNSDSNMYHHGFTPALTLKFDSTSDYYYGSDSLDINLDNNFDLVITQRILFDFDVKDRYDYTYDNYPFTRLTLKNGLEVAILEVNYPIGQGQTQEQFWVDTLNVNDQIDGSLEWSETNRDYSLWYVSPSSFQVNFGSWFDLIDEAKFIGIRMKINSHYKYGWIKINQHSRENIEIISYAIEK